MEAAMVEKVLKSDAEWRAQLTPAQYAVARQKGTERPFTGEYVATTTPGTYRCVACGQELFGSDAKFDSHCGWPSFTGPVEATVIETETDRTHGMLRTE